jgi:Predicted transcription factor, homolog of eukaryotic MBF1
MEELRKTIGHNLSELRKKKGLTQAELAEKLNYSDKAISKWEHGDAMPSIENLITICKFYSITLDQLTSDNISNLKVVDDDAQNTKNKIVITALSFIIVWALATIIYVTFIILLKSYYWIVFVWALPLSIVDLIVFNSVWGKSKRNFALITLLIWVLLAAIYVQAVLEGYSFLWVIFFLGIPATIITILWSQLKRVKR